MNILQNESVSAELTFIKRKYEEFEIELTKLRENLELEVNSKNNIERMLNDKMQQLEMQIREVSVKHICTYEISGDCAVSCFMFSTKKLFL